MENAQRDAPNECLINFPYIFFKKVVLKVKFRSIEGKKSVFLAFCHRDWVIDSSVLKLSYDTHK